MSRGEAQGSSSRGRPASARRRARHVSLALGLAASCIVVACLALDLLQPVESVVMNLEMRWRGSRPAQPDVVVVAIDEASVDSLGRWPWPRDCFAAVIRALDAAGARTLALDVVFSEPTRSPPGVDLAYQDQELADAFADAGDVVLGFFFRQQEAPAPADGGEPVAAPDACAAPTAVDELPLTRAALEVGGGPWPVKSAAGAEPNLDLFEGAAAGMGFFSHEREEGVQQRYDLVTRLDDDGVDFYYPALALAAVARYRGEEVRVIDAGGAPQLRLGGATVSADDALRLWIDYAGPRPQDRYPTLSALDVLSLPADELAERVGGKLVFVGATEVGVGDLVSTPFGEMPGVEVHAHAAGNLLSGRFVRDGFPQLLVSTLALFALGLLVPLLVATVRRHLVGSLLAIAAVFAWPLACHVVFRLAGWHLQVVAPMLAGGLALVASLRYQIGTVDRHARRVKGLFQRYVSPEVVDELLGRERVELGGEKRVMTVLFSDIRGFTNMSEDLDSTAVVALLNEFFTPMTRLVLERGGTLDKYMGDAMMAFFGAPLEQPDHARRACEAALAMRAELRRLNEGWRQTGRIGDGKAGIGIGIGVNSGEMTVGNMGSDAVFDYTVIGDAVNLGSRVEGLNKVYGTEALVTDATVAAAGEGFLFRRLDRVRVKGKSEAVELYELMAAEPAPPQLRATADAFAAGLERYLARDFAAAERTFAALAEAGDGPAALYVERCRAYRATPPPAGWDGVETFTSK